MHIVNLVTLRKGEEGDTMFAFIYMVSIPVLTFRLLLEFI